MTINGLRKAIAQFSAWQGICNDAEARLLRILAEAENGHSIDDKEVFCIVGQATWAIRKQVQKQENERVRFGQGSADSGTPESA